MLIITHVTSADYGNYECVARNELGFSTSSPRLEITSAPDIPSLLSIVNVTHESVTLSWIPGFNGGMPATYRIRYRQIQEESYKYEDIPSPNTTQYTIKGLEINTGYVFSISALNKLGNSKFMPDIVTAKTTSKLRFCASVCCVFVAYMLLYKLTIGALLYFHN